MSFKWEVPPGDWTIGSLRANFVSQMFLAVNRSADQIAIEAEQWMKDNAPWKDVEVRRRSKRARTTRLKEGEDAYERVFPAGNARKHLTARVRRESKAQAKLREATNREAAIRDAQKLGRLNKQRAKNNQIPLKRLPKQYRTARIEEPRERIVQLELSHGIPQRVPYAIWLEIAHQGRFSIIDKATYYWGAKLMSRLKQAGVTLGDDPKPPRYDLEEKETNLTRTYAE